MAAQVVVNRGPNGFLGIEFQRDADKEKDPYVVTGITYEVGRDGQMFALAALL